MSDTGTPVDLRADGLLWLINTVVFHPRGFALALDVESGAFSLMGDGTERWRYEESPVPYGVPGDDLWAAAEAAFKRAANKPTGTLICNDPDHHPPRCDCSQGHPS